MADDGTVDEGRDNFYYVLNNVIKGNHLPCPNSVTPLLPELPEVPRHDCVYEVGSVHAHPGMLFLLFTWSLV